MSKSRIGVIAFCTVWCSTFACGQEFVVPEGPGSEAVTAGAPSSGFTGAGGAGDEPETPSRLPLPDGPLHGPLGGAGGEAGQAGEPGSSDPVAAATGGTRTGSSGSGPGASGTAGTRADGAGGAGGDSGDPSVGRRILFFSEYLEGTGSLKALEIFSVNAVSLEGCSLRTYFNGKTEATPLALHGHLPAGGVQVLCSSGLATAQPDACDRSTNLTFNGDDAIALVCGSLTYDVIGQIGVDPGDSWAGATMDRTLRRRCEIGEGRSDGSLAFDPSTEWTLLGADQFDDLGRHDCPDMAGTAGAGGESAL
jgi:hypothetical protein